jgi:hypothetical protein
VSLVRLVNRPCVLLIRGEDGADAMGNPIRVETRVDAVCELQQIRRTEPPADGEVSDTLWKVWLLPGTVIDTGDAVEVDDDVYELVGAPWPVRDPFRGVDHHVEASCRRVAGAEDS